MSKFLLLFGASGVGKNTIIEELFRLDNRFIYISPYTTRAVRKGERNKISISNEQMAQMWNRGELLVINELYGIRYATPRLPILEALSKNFFPVLDWPISKIEIMIQAFPDQLHLVYVSPPSIDILRQRLARDRRDIDGVRLQEAIKELDAYWSSKYSEIFDFEIVSSEDNIFEIAQAIYSNYLKAL